MKTAADIISNQCLYNANSSTFVKHDLPIPTPSYTELVRGTVVDGTYSKMILQQTSCVLHTQKLRRTQ